MVTLARGALFEIPFWSAQLDAVVPYHTAMSREVEELIDETPADDPPRFLAHQTASDPFHLPSAGWQVLAQLSNECYARLAKQHFQRWRSGEFHLRRWAIRFGKLDAEDKARLVRDAVHNHQPALFSSIYYLKVPPEFVDNEAGGTRFINPLGHLMDLMTARTMTLAPREGRLVIFPSFIDHAPAPLEWDSAVTTRIVVSSDIFYVSGQSSGAAEWSIVRAAAEGQ